MNRWRVRDGEIYFDGRLFGHEIPGLPTIFAMEAREDLELGARRAREAAMVEAAEMTGVDIGPDCDDQPCR